MHTGHAVRAFTPAAKRRRSGPAQEVQQRGSAVLHSEVFGRALQERHHWTSVGAHSLGVASDALRLAGFLERLGLRADRDVLVLCALCHDLGIIDRLQKYGDSAARCCREHPGESLLAFEKYFHPASPTERDCILHHMFPLRPVPPHTLEGLIINLADKSSSVREAFARGRHKAAGTAGPHGGRQTAGGPSRFQRQRVDGKGIYL